MTKLSPLAGLHHDTGTFPWWHGATIYQIYPRSFMDSNGDGIGDLPGITAKLGYVADLGVDAIWVSPFYTSPMLDFGYDVAEFRGVDPIFGTLADFDALVEKAHGLGLKVIVDQVYSHSSDQHRWFKESRASRDNPKADWYVWADPKEDGTAPNNWQSLFSGPAWAWDAGRQQFYLHNFLTEQPDLNLHNREVQDELLEVARFWLERGVDGFRIDAVLHMGHDPQLRDNPPSSNPAKVKCRGHDYQDNIYNQGHPVTFEFLDRLRAVTNEYGAVFTVAEVGGVGVLDFAKACAAGETRVNSAYSFDFLYAQALTPKLVCGALAEWPDEPGVGWPSFAFENHDAPRAISRWDDCGQRAAFLRFKLALVCALRGNVILYQGEELGLEQVEIPYELIQDPEALRNWPLTLSRDGARTPLPWSDADEQAGFTTGIPWLPVGERNRALAVAGQQADPASLLHHTQAMIALRNAHPALRHGRVASCRHEGQLLQLVREHEGERLTWLFNFGTGALDLDAALAGSRVLCALNGANVQELPAFGALLVEG